MNCNLWPVGIKNIAGIQNKISIGDLAGIINCY